MGLSDWCLSIRTNHQPVVEVAAAAEYFRRVMLVAVEAAVAVVVQTSLLLSAGFDQTGHQSAEAETDFARITPQH